MTNNYKELAAKLMSAHHKNQHGVWCLDSKKLSGLIINAMSANGTSGLGHYKGMRVYWYQQKDTFVVEAG